MFELNVNVGDLKRVFGIIRCSGEKANVIMSDNVLCIESIAPIATFSRARIRSCGGITFADGDDRFVVDTGHVLGVLSTGRNHEIANISYDGGGKLSIRICNVLHIVDVDADSDIKRSRYVESHSFVVIQNVCGKDFIAISKSAVGSKASDISLSSIKALFRFGSNGGKYVSYVEAHSCILTDYYSKFDPSYIYNISKLVRCDNEIRFMFGNNYPALVSFELNMWSIDYLLAPIVDT